MGPQHQRQVLALDLDPPVAAKRDRYVDEGLIALTGLLGVNPVDFVAGAVGPAGPPDWNPIVGHCATPECRASRSEALLPTPDGHGPLRHPSHPASVGLACRPVGAWRRQLVKRLQSQEVLETLCSSVGELSAVVLIGMEVVKHHVPVRLSTSYTRTLCFRRRGCQKLWTLSTLTTAPWPRPCLRGQHHGAAEGRGRIHGRTNPNTAVSAAACSYRSSWQPAHREPIVPPIPGNHLKERKVIAAVAVAQ